MIRFERKETEKSKQAIESLQKEKARHGSYNTEEVNAALREMFYEKCYLCEMQKISSYQIEHYVPHKGDDDLKYDWNNLLLSCAHCNNTKGTKYNKILNCCEVEVDKYIAFRKRGYFGTEEVFEFEPLDEAEETLETAKLLKEIHYGHTPQKKMESLTIRREIRKELSDFKEYVRQFEEAEGEFKKDLLYLIKRELGPTRPFTAFKRWIIWDNRERYPELAECISY